MKVDCSALRRFFQGRPEVLWAYLFGSHAVGRARPDSDVDIGVYLDLRRVEDLEAYEEQLWSDLSRFIALGQQSIWWY